MLAMAMTLMYFKMNSIIPFYFEFSLSGNNPPFYRSVRITTGVEFPLFHIIAPLSKLAIIPTDYFKKLLF